eukprot:UN06308
MKYTFFKILHSIFAKFEMLCEKNDKMHMIFESLHVNYMNFDLVFSFKLALKDSHSN